MQNPLKTRLYKVGKYGYESIGIYDGNDNAGQRYNEGDISKLSANDLGKSRDVANRSSNLGSKLTNSYGTDSEILLMEVAANGDYQYRQISFKELLSDVNYAIRNIDFRTLSENKLESER